MARWKVSPLRGAAPELSPWLHPSHPSRLGLNRAAGEGAGGGAAATGRSGRSGRLARAPNAPAGPDLTMGSAGRRRPLWAGAAEPPGGRRPREGDERAGPRRTRGRRGAEARPAGPERGSRRGRGRPRARQPPPRRAALTCAARAIAHSAADAQRLRRSRGRRPAAPPRGRTAPALGKRPPAPRRARAAPPTIAWHNSPEPPRPKSGRRRPAPSPGPPRGRCHAGKAHRRPRRSLPPALRPCRNAASRAGATLPCAAAAGGRGRWPPCGPVGELWSLRSAAPSLDQAVSSLPSELGSAGIRRRAGA
uniref:uncharacterized protein LOC132670366 isoform X2 n=1 Tax=Panthera onca TaxID=9690 RepID=UPI00295581DB|nr:uncharacterized protein LOC132670366 isoform X2 [Panthera onca]